VRSFAAAGYLLLGAVLISNPGSQLVWGQEKRLANAAPNGIQDRILEHAGVKRTYRLHLPKSVQGKPVPLVIALHGMGADGKIMEVLTGFTSLADRKGFAVVYPDGQHKIWNFWGNEDVGFIKTLIAKLGGLLQDHRGRAHLAGRRISAGSAPRQMHPQYERL
jgi:poly(3-hydroxybutyrate) depolymerase